MNEAITITPAGAEDAVAISSVLAANRDDPGLFQESVTAVVRTRGKRWGPHQVRISEQMQRANSA
jgi:hypothetical protein